ncbi:MAG: hypothetical protein DRI28_02460 [Caldiserica bacterium]|nr:MAG: hypothetical protein DRI28_02460 [Caldisericota bacterium]
MKKILLLVFVVFLVLAPTFVFARGIIKDKGDVVVKPDDIVRGDIKVGVGNVTVFGKVFGNISVLRGDIILKDKAFVSGNVVTLGGKIIEEGEAVVKGRKIEFPPKNNIPYKRPRIPAFLLTNEGFVLKIIIILILLIFSVIFAGLFKEGFSSFVNFSRKNLILSLPLGIVVLTLLLYFTPERAIFPFGRALFLLYNGIIYFLILMGMSILSYLVGEKILKLLHQEVKNGNIKEIITTLIGGLLILLLILIPKIGIYLLSITASLSFGVSFSYLIYKIIKS